MKEIMNNQVRAVHSDIIYNHNDNILYFCVCFTIINFTCHYFDGLKLAYSQTSNHEALIVKHTQSSFYVQISRPID